MSADEGGLGTERLAELIREEAIANGLAQPGELHSWRCDYPDRYGPCDCLGEFVRDMTAAIAPMVDRLARERDEARAALRQTRAAVFTSVTHPGMAQGSTHPGPASMCSSEFCRRYAPETGS